MALRFEELEEFLADFGGFHSVRGTVLAVTGGIVRCANCLFLKRLIIRDRRRCAAALAAALAVGPGLPEPPAGWNALSSLFRPMTFG
jgi:hypothetical protein